MGFSLESIVLITEHCHTVCEIKFQILAPSLNVIDDVTLSITSVRLSPLNEEFLELCSCQVSLDSEYSTYRYGPSGRKKPISDPVVMADTFYATLELINIRIEG